MVGRHAGLGCYGGQMQVLWDRQEGKVRIEGNFSSKRRSSLNVQSSSVGQMTGR